MYCKIIFLIITLFHFFISRLAAQNINIQSVKNNIETFSNNFPQERIYIHFDKPSYLPGETIWCKAYLMSGISTSEISKTIYIDFTDANGNLLSHTVVPSIQSSGKTQYTVPETYTANSIHIIAYTKWMMNF